MVAGVLLITGRAMALMVLVPSIVPVVPAPSPPHAVRVATMIAHHAKRWMRRQEKRIVFNTTDAPFVNAHGRQSAIRRCTEKDQ
jgi:predicted alternative tryptophan synthase beta-subunit